MIHDVGAEEPPQIEQGASDVLAEEEVVHVPVGVEELVGSHEHPSTFLPDVPAWEESDGRP
jgi:hypothetical protein